MTPHHRAPHHRAAHHRAAHHRAAFHSAGPSSRRRLVALAVAGGVISVGAGIAGAETATAATAATVRLSSDSLGASIVYNGGSDNSNTLRVVREGTKWAVTDRVALTASGGCASVSSTKALCDTRLGGSEVRRVFVQLGDRNDSASIEGLFSGNVFGDAGDDVMLAGKGDVSGNSALTYNGGPGTDTVTYAGIGTAVRVSLDDQANDGPVQSFGTSRDNVRDDVEQVTGTNAADTFVGDDRPSTFNGLAGNDTFDPGTNVDRVNGGSGNDTFLVKDGFVDFVDGGAGTDTATRDSFDSLTGVETLR